MDERAPLTIEMAKDEEGIYADVVIRDGLRKFITYQLHSKFLNVVDGLKLVQRRIVHTIGTEQKDISTAHILGEVMRIHPHGDMPISDAIARMTQKFSIGYQLVGRNKPLGTYLKPNSYAHYRYTSITSSKFVRDVYFEGVFAKSLTMCVGNTLKDEEPLFFIPRLPMALLLNSKTIGCGLSSASIPLDLSAVCDLVKEYILNDCEFDEDMYKYLIPNTPVPMYMLNYTQYMDRITNPKYKRRTAPLSVEGWIDIRGNVLIINTVGYENLASTLSNHIDEEMKKKSSYLYKELMNVDYGHDQTILTFKKSTNIHKFVSDFRKSLYLTSTSHPNPNYILPNGSVQEVDVVQIINYWYDARLTSIEVGARFEIDRLKKRRFVYEAIMLVVHELDEVVATIRKSEREEAVSKLVKRFGIMFSQAKAITEMPLIDLNKSSIEECQKNIESINLKLAELEHVIRNPREVVLKDLAVLKQRYAKTHPRNLRVDPFIGMVKYTNGGITQFESIDDLIDCINKMGGRIDHARTYVRPAKFKRMCERMEQGHPAPYVLDKLTLPVKSSTPWCPFKDEYAETIYERGNTDYSCVHSKGGVQFYKNIPPMKEIEAVPPSSVVPLASQCLCLLRNGKVVKEKVSKFFGRKSKNWGLESSIVAAVPANIGKAYVFYMCENEKNIIRAVHMTEGMKVALPPLDNIHYVGVASVSQTGGSVMTVSDKCIERLRAKVIVVENVKSLINTGKASIMLELNKGKQKDGGVVKVNTCKQVLRLIF